MTKALKLLVADGHEIDEALVPTKRSISTGSGDTHWSGIECRNRWIGHESCECRPDQKAFRQRRLKRVWRFNQHLTSTQSWPLGYPSHIDSAAGVSRRPVIPLYHAVPVFISRIFCEHPAW